MCNFLFTVFCNYNFLLTMVYKNKKCGNICRILRFYLVVSATGVCDNFLEL